MKMLNLDQLYEIQLMLEWAQIEITNKTLTELM